MYTPELFKLDGTDEAKGFIQQNSFGILINKSEGKIVATHIPMILLKNKTGQEVLSGHISKANVQLQHLNGDNEVLCIFQGPHAYISSSWYNHENVPTWNYIAIHVYGKIKIIEGDELLHALNELVNKYEAGSEHPVSVQSLSEPFLKKEIKGITGFEIQIDRIEGAKKLSQNRDEVNFNSIVGHLVKKGDANSIEISNQMEKLKPGKNGK